jgi:hypothetical protein
LQSLIKIFARSQMSYGGGVYPPTIPVVEGGPAGSGVCEATIRSLAERLGARLLRDIRRERLFSDTSQ